MQYCGHILYLKRETEKQNVVVKNKIRQFFLLFFFFYVAKEMYFILHL